MPFIYDCVSFKNAFCKEDHSVAQIVNKRLEILRARKRLVPSATLKVYDRSGLYIQRFTGQGTNMRVVIQEHKFQREKEEHAIYLLREYISQGQYEPRWQSNVLPHIESGNYKAKYPIDESELRQAEEEYLSLIEKGKNKMLPSPPPEITAWFLEEGFSINPEFRIYETQDWMAFSASYIKEYANDFYRLIQAAYSKEERGDMAFERIREVEANRNLSVAQYEEDVYLIYEECLDKDDNCLFLLHNGGVIAEEQPTEREAKVRRAIDYEPLRAIKNGQYTVEQFSKGAVRAYPASILTGRRKEWREIQTHSNKSNLALSPEQLALLKDYNFPKFINGQAGSGKSEMLYYLFAEILFRQKVYDFPGPIVFLSENEELLKKALYDTRSKLQGNSQYQGAELDSADIQEHFYPFRRFLLEKLVEDEALYPEGKHVNFAKFKVKYEQSRLAKSVIKRYPAEIAWFIIYSFIKGYDAGKEEFTPQDFDQLYKRDKGNIDRDTYQGVFEEVWTPFYKKLRDKGYWDQLDLVRDILQAYESLPESQKYVAILCDEAQDFTKVELQLLIRLSRFTDYRLEKINQVPITFAGDPFQTVNPTGFSLEKLKRLFNKELVKELQFTFQKELVADLRYNYRSSGKIVDFANAVQYFRRTFLNTTDLRSPQEAKRFGDSPTPLVFCVQKDERKLKEKLGTGVVYILACNDGEEEEWIQEDDWLEPSFIVKSAARSKGSEYPSVALYKFGEQFAKEFSAELVAQLIDGELQFDQLDAGLQFKIAFFFNKLYVAITRAQEECYVLDTKQGIDSFWKVLQKLSHLEIEDPTWQEAVKHRFIETGNLETLHNTDRKNLLMIAQEDKANGLSYEDPDKMLDAAKAYGQLGSKYVEDVAYCRAKAFQFSHRYKEAGDAFADIERDKDASDCYWIGQYWEELLSLRYSGQDKKMKIRQYVASIMDGSADSHLPILEFGKTLFASLEEPECRSKITWKDGFVKTLSTRLLAWEEAISQEDAKSLASTLSTFGLHDQAFLDAAARLYCKAEQFSEAVACWELGEDYHHAPYYQAKLRAAVSPVEKAYYYDKLGQTKDIVEVYSKHRDSFAQEEELKIVLNALNNMGLVNASLDLIQRKPLLWPYLQELTLAKNQLLDKVNLLMANLIELLDGSKLNKAEVLTTDLFEKIGNKILAAVFDKVPNRPRADDLAAKLSAVAQHNETAMNFVRLIARSALTPERLASTAPYVIVQAAAQRAIADKKTAVLSPFEWACAIERTHQKYVEAISLFEERGFLLLNPKLTDPEQHHLLSRWVKIQFKRALNDRKQPANQRAEALAAPIAAAVEEMLKDHLAALKRKRAAVAEKYTVQLEAIDKIPLFPDYYTFVRPEAPSREGGDSDQLGGGGHPTAPLPPEPKTAPVVPVEGQLDGADAPGHKRASQVSKSIAESEPGQTETRAATPQAPPSPNGASIPTPDPAPRLEEELAVLQRELDHARAEISALKHELAQALAFDAGGAQEKIERLEQENNQLWKEIGALQKKLIAMYEKAIQGIDEDSD